MITILQGDCRETLKTLPSASVHCCVTSPPYWGLRDYGGEPLQIGLESSPSAYVEQMVAVFAEVWRVLRDDGTLWLNLGDSYATGSGKVGESHGGGAQGERWSGHRGARKGSPKHAGNAMGPMTQPNRLPQAGLKPKDLCGIPWRVAFALQEAGWYLRSEIIWHKPNPMPESVTDRPTKAHETIFLLTKSPRYYYDAEAIKERAVSDHDSGNSFQGRQGGAAHLPMSGGAGGPQWKSGRGGKNAFRGQGHFRETEAGPANREGRDMQDVGAGENRNKRTVWTVATKPYRDAHFATYPPALITPCVLAGCPAGGTVLDPFGGSGTTGEVAVSLGRRAILCELNADYVSLIKTRTSVTGGIGL